MIIDNSILNDTEIVSDIKKRDFCLEVDVLNRFKEENFHPYTIRTNKYCNYNIRIKLKKFENSDEEYLNARFIARHSSKKMDNKNFAFYDRCVISKN